MDVYLEDFINCLNTNVGEHNYILVLTSDHGVASFPEFSNVRDTAYRITQSVFHTDINLIDKKMRKIFNLDTTSILLASYDGVEPNFNAIAATAVDSADFVDSLTMLLKELYYIEECYSFYDIQSKLCSKQFIENARNSFNPNHGYFIKLLPTKGSLIDMREYGTTHGTPYSYDTHVPLIFYSSSLKPMSIKKEVYTVDIAPTLLSMLGIERYKEMDGEVIISNSSSK